MYKYNILYVVGVIILFIIIIVFNAKMNPYDLDYSDKVFKIKHPDMVSAEVKLSQGHKYEILVIGTSATEFMFNYIEPKDKRLANLSKDVYLFPSLKEYLKFFLDTHQEVEKVVIPIEYQVMFLGISSNAPRISGRNLNLKELQKLYLSVDACKLSFVKLYKNWIHKNHDFERKKHKQGRNIFIKVYPNRPYNFALHSEKEVYADFESLKETFKMLSEKDIEKTLIFLPYHSLYNSILYMHDYYKYVEELKRMVVKENPGCRILDFNFVNDITAQPLKDTWLYVDILHPQSEMGELFSDVIFNEKTKMFNNLKPYYYELTSDNIEGILKMERQKLEQYMKNNNEYIETFLKPENEHGEFYIEKDCTNRPKNILDTLKK